MKAFLINLDRDQDRLAHMRGQFKHIGIPFCRVTGLLGSDSYDKANFLTAGESGCFLSHQKAWGEVAKLQDGKVAAIFEDDVHFSPKMRQFLSNDDWIPRQADIVRFETTYHSMRFRGPHQKTLDGIKIREVRFNAWGTAGYVIRVEAARWLMHAPARFYRTPDHFLFDRNWSPVAHMLSVYQLIPALCIQDKYHSASGRINFDSNVQYAEGPKGVIGQARQAIRPIARLVLGRQLVPYEACKMRRD